LLLERYHRGCLPTEENK